MTWRSFWRLLREFTGDRAYEQYLEHRAATHPGEPVLPEKEFWRLRTDSRPPSGCC
jgi:uncharacterized short protein YbdD (DUF466 family)